jgi:hypothetical protein
MDHIDHDTPDGATGAVPTDRRPLGYWLRAVDHLISDAFASALAEEEVTRRDWMLLNAVSGDVDVPGLAERLARKGKRLAGLEKRGWVDQTGDGTWTLTDEGRAAKERIGAIVDGVRTRVAGAVSPEEFATTMASLEAIARELGWSEENPGHGERRGFGPGFGRGFGPGFGPRGRGFGFGRPGFGHGGPGFRPEFSPVFDPRSEHEHGCDHGRGHGPADQQGHGHGHGPADHGHGHGGEQHSERFGGESHGRHGHGSPAGRHGHERHEHTAEQAYERGFDAGYARGAAER